MQITDLLNNYIANTSAGKTMADMGQSVPARLNSTLFDMLPKGSIFEGSVLSVNGENVTIGLTNGSSLLARLDAGVNIEKGQSVFFQVKANDGHTIALKSISSEVGSNPIVQGALNNAGVRVSGESILMIDSMMRNGMSVNSESVLNMNRQVVAHPDINPQTIVEMNKYEIPVTAENAKHYEAFVADQAQLGEDVAKVSDELGKLLGSESLSPKESIGLAKDILNVLDTRLPDVSERSEQSVAEPAVNAENAANAKNIDSSIPVIDKDVEDSKAPETTEALKPALKEEIKIFEGETKNQVLKDVISDKELMKLETSVKEFKGFIEEKKELFNEDGHLKPEVKAKDVLKAVVDFAAKLEQPEEQQAVKKLFGTKHFSKLLKDSFDDAWRLSPEQTKDKDVVKNLFAKINLDTSKIIESLEKLPQEAAGAARESIDKFTGNLNFQNQFNEFYNFVQIPLKMANQNATGELYVYSGGRKAKVLGPDDELTAFLHFDLKNLGSTDISVKLKNKDVKCDWVLEDEISMKIIEDNLGLLEAALNKKGYNCKFSVSADDEAKSDFVADFLKQDTKADNFVRRYSFDMQA